MRIDYLFKSGQGYNELVQLVQSNKRFIFFVYQQDTRDKRTKNAHLSGWCVLHHRKREGNVKIVKKDGVCWTELKDASGGRQLSGAWLAWVASNATDIMSGVDVRFD